MYCHHLKCYRRSSLSLLLKRPFSRRIWVSQYQNVSIQDFIGAKDDGDGGIN